MSESSSGRSDVRAAPQPAASGGDGHSSILARTGRASPRSRSMSAAAVPPTPDDLELNNSGSLKWETAFLWYSTAGHTGGVAGQGRGWALVDHRRGPGGPRGVSRSDDIRRHLGAGLPGVVRGHKAPRPRAWLIRGSSVSGHNLVPLWLAEGFVSLPAKNLTDLPDPYEKAELRAAVDEGYASRTSSYRRSIVTTYDRFLGQMAIGDPGPDDRRGHGARRAESAGTRPGPTTTPSRRGYVGASIGDSPTRGSRIRRPARSAAEAAGDLR